MPDKGLLTLQIDYDEDDKKQYNRNVHPLLHNETVSTFAADLDKYMINLSNVSLSRIQKETLSVDVTSASHQHLSVRF